MSWLAGALLERPPGPKYTGALSFAELCPTAPLPKVATLAKWRRQLPSDLHLGLRAPSALWGGAAIFPSGDAQTSAVTWIADGASALGAAFVVLSTGSRLTTGQRDRDRLAAIVEAVGERLDAPIVWLPGGLWELSQAQRFARKIGAVCGLDGTDPAVAAPGDAPSAALVYTFLKAEGVRHSFPPSALAEHVARVAAHSPTRAFTTIASRRSFDEAKTLQRLFDEHPAHSRESDGEDSA